MIRRNSKPFFLLIFLVLFFLFKNNLDLNRKKFLNFEYISYTTPSKITGIVSLEFKGIVSDFIFLKMMTSIGDKIGRKVILSSDHANYIYKSADLITDLDPYFWDAYLFADMNLSWGFGEYEKANKMLVKASKYLPNDFKVPYYLGFNYFYFLKDNVNGAKYLMEASRLPHCPAYIPELASRLSVYSLQHKTAIIFLKEILQKTRSSIVAKQLEKRLKTLIILDSLENTLDLYKQEYGYYPKKLAELLKKKFIKKIPDDPYGGEFYILDNGRVYTTSKMRKSK